MKVIFISGPFRGPSAWVIQQHVMAAMAAALEVWRLGAVAICPHANTMFFQGAAPDTVWLRGDLELLRRSDALFLVDGWAESAGVHDELAEATACRIPVFDSISVLADWLTKEQRP